MARIDFVTGNAQRYLPDVETLAAIPDRVEELLAGRSSAELRRAPAARDDQDAQGDEWSPARIIGHLISYARHHGERFHNMAWMTDPVFVEYDDEQEARENAWQSSDGARLLDSLREAIAGTVDVLKDLPDASWGRAGIHPSAGRRSIRQQLRLNLDHYDEHIAQLQGALEPPAER